MSKFRVLVWKELITILRDPRIIIPLIVVPAVLYPAIMGIITYGMKKSMKKTPVLNICVVNLDRGDYSRKILDKLRLYGFTNSSLSTIKIIIPENFSEKLKQGLKPKIIVHIRISKIEPGLSVSPEIKSVMALNNIIESVCSEILANEFGVKDISMLKKPVTIEYNTTILGFKTNIDPSIITSGIVNQIMTLSFIVFIIAVYVAQIGVTSFAQEKELKTLETLLTIPVPRYHILLSKAIAIIIVAVIATLTTTITFYKFTSTLTYMPEEVSSQLKQISKIVNSKLLTEANITLISLNILLTLIFIIALSLLPAVFAKDVRSAQSLVGPLIFLVLFPVYIVNFGLWSTLSTTGKIGLAIIPFTITYIIPYWVLNGEYTYTALGLIYLTAVTIGTFTLISKLFSSERMLTAPARRRMRLKWRRIRLSV